MLNKKKEILSNEFTPPSQLGYPVQQAKGTPNHFLEVQKIEESKKMDYSPEILLTPHNYLECKPKILILLIRRGLYQITMEMEVEPDSVDEKNDFLNRQDMAIGCIFWSISPEILHQVYDESRASIPNELWTRLEVLSRNKEDCENLCKRFKI